MGNFLKEVYVFSFIMNKILVFMLLVLAVVFTGCGSDNAENEVIESDVADDLNLSEDEVKNITESAEVLMEENNVSVDVNSEGNVIVRSDKGSAEVLENGDVVITNTDGPELNNFENLPAFDVWCIPGTEVNKEASEGISTIFTIVGVNEFKDDLFCMLEGTVNSAGMTADVVLYVNEDDSDFWVVTKFGGQEIEQHVINGVQQ